MYSTDTREAPLTTVWLNQRWASSGVGNTEKHSENPSHGPLDWRSSALPLRYRATPTNLEISGPLGHLKYALCRQH